MTSQEKIARVEQAPKEMQVMVAKAFLRDDICDDDIQYLFNADTIEELNDPNEKTVIEHVNAEDPEGIGAAGFVMRITKPSGNENYITTGAGGWNTCIKGYPMDANANVLSNCVGYASGRFNEIINLARDTQKCTYTKLNCNATDFVDRAKLVGLKVGMTPKVGAIMCWGNNSAGHVAIVERVDNDNQVYTSESSYGSTAFWNQIRTNANGRWGLASIYYFKGFIYLPDDVQVIIESGNAQPAETPTPIAPIKTIEEIAKEVIKGAWGNGNERKQRLEAAGYNYAEVQAMVDKLMGGNVQSQPTPAAFNIGDKVTIIGTGNGSKYGNGQTAYGIGWSRQILNIHEGFAYPYQVGNNTGTTGFYKADALRK